MTTLNLTITPERAYLSQDHALWQGGKLEPVAQGATKSTLEAAHNTFIGNGERPEPFSGEMVEKITCLPNRNMLVGGSGAFTHTAAWPMRIAGEMPDGDISDIAHLVPEMLKSLIETIPSDVEELVIIQAGWSQQEKRVIGYAYDRYRNFEPVRLDHGHTHMPVANPEAPEYGELAALWRDAVQGCRVEAFHAALFANQRWSYQQGKLRKGVHLSESYTLATADADGARRLN
ncbi:hypothetical protein [Halomonas sp. B23F22_20]|uniref:hypothetical protein n=1 Tax=Halomonas sp. B23F22_10 TaxID=3459515 RepID=UPI004038D229